MISKAFLNLQSRIIVYLSFICSFIGSLRFNTTGTGYSNSAETPNKLHVVFDNGSLGNYNVWDTDYTTFSLVYSCKPTTVGGKQMKEENAWILSRTSTLNQDLIVKMRAVLSAGGVNVGKLSAVDQSCSQ
jgi:lipocalin